MVGQAAAPGAAAASAEPPRALHAGGFAYVTGIAGRTGLNDEVIQLGRLDTTADRWVCEKGDGEMLRIRPANLVPLSDDDT